MLLRLLPCADPPPTSHPPTITPPTYVMTQSGAIRRGGQPGNCAEGNQGNKGNQRGRQLVDLRRLLPSAVGLQLPASSRQPSAVIRQPPASSFQLLAFKPYAVSLQPPASSRQPAPNPSPERREATAKPSAQFSRPFTRPTRAKRLQAL